MYIHIYYISLIHNHEFILIYSIPIQCHRVLLFLLPILPLYLEPWQIGFACSYNTNKIVSEFNIDTTTNNKLKFKISLQFRLSLEYISLRVFSQCILFKSYLNYLFFFLFGYFIILMYN